MKLKIPRINGPLILVFLVLVLLMPRAAKFNYDYRKGSPWQYEDLFAQFDFPILKTEDQIEAEIEKAGSAVIPYYKYSDKIVGSSIKEIERLDLGEYNSLKTQILAHITRLYSRGILSDEKAKVDGISASVSDEVLFIQKNKKAEKSPFAEVYRETEARNKLLADLVNAYPEVNMDSVLSKSGVYEALAPNLIFDKATTELAHAESADYISPTQGYVSAGQRIVSEGEIITAETAQILDSYKVEYERSLGYEGPTFLIWLGNIVLAAAIVLILTFSIYYANPQIFFDRNRYLYLLTVFLIAAVTSFWVVKFHSELVYLVPFTVITTYLLAFFKKQVVLPVYVVSLLPLLVFSKTNGIELFFMYFSAGVFSIFSFQYFSRGWKQFVTAMIVFGILGLTFTGFRLIYGDSFNVEYFARLLYLFLGSLLSVAFYPLIFLFEKIFNLVSQTRLEELADTNNKLLRELAKKAPGTFQHSIQVMNMADAAARAVGADVALIRAGALYHDIGKMNNPLCFVENENSLGSGRKYHNGLSPLQSARDIIRHVPDGIELAEKNGLPDVIVDFIKTHHGTSSAAYFLNTYLNGGGDPGEVSDFYYQWGKPATEEQVIVMLCDTLEAASRTIKDGGQEAYSKLVDDVFNAKLKDGQLNSADISMRDLHKILRVLKNYLAQLYHERIVYPKRKDAE